MGYETTDDKHPDAPLVTAGNEERRLVLVFGRQTFPDNLRAVWGARLIWPNDLVHNRQDLTSRDIHAKNDLMTWLNTIGIKGMREALRTPARLGLSPKEDNEVVIFEDDKGKIVGSAQASGGYVYVAGWLKEHEVQ